MLEEIMRKGTSSLGTDVPSEREINRLAARSDEEFWLFERMDEERRQRENYRSRLMEEHEVPDWVYTVPEMKAGKAKGSLDFDTPVTGKRRRKEVIREDTITDVQWMKAVKNGEDPSKLSSKRRRESLPLSMSNNVINSTAIATIPNNVSGEKKAAESRSETLSRASDAKSEDTMGWTTCLKLKSEAESSHRSSLDSLGGSLNGLTWSTHKRKRSSLM